MQGRELRDACSSSSPASGAAFGSPKRVEIVNLLAQGERSVESIADVTGMSVANPSRHLQVLRAAGLLVSRRDGLHVRYRLADVVDGYRTLQAPAEARVGFDGHGGCFIETGADRAAYGAGDLYADPAPAVTLHTPARRWHWGKAAFEFQVMRRWL